MSRRRRPPPRRAERQHDSFLLTTYTRVQDIEQLRDERIALIDGQMQIARGSLESNQQRTKDLEQRLRNFLPYSTAPNARPVPDKLAEEVVRSLKERNQLRDALTVAREGERPSCARSSTRMSRATRN